MSAIKTERVGARIYISGNTYPIKDRLKAIGCHPERGDDGQWRWWIGAAKANALQSIIDGATQANGSATSGQTKPVAADDTRLVGKAKYKGRTYYVAWVGQTKAGAYKARLLTLDGSVDFWADAARPHEQCDGSGPVAAIIKTYAAREYRGHTEYTTLGSIRHFVERETRNRQAGGDVCAECGRSGELVADLEDGLLKHYRCCDIPPR